MEKNGGCEAAVKRGRVRVGPNWLAGWMQTEDPEGEVAGGQKRGRRGQGRRRRGDDGVSRRAGAAGGRIGENRARLGFAMTNGGRGHSARRSYRSEGKRERVREGLSTTLDSPWSASLCPGHLIRPRRGSFVFLVFQRAGPPRQAAPYFPFVRAIYRPALSFSFLFLFLSIHFSRPLSPVPHRLFLRLECDTYLPLERCTTYLSQNSMMRMKESPESETLVIYLKNNFTSTRTILQELFILFNLSKQVRLAYR